MPKSISQESSSRHPIMQAVILAAGRGLRLKPITDNIPKALVEINGVSFLNNALNALTKHKEVEEVIIVVGYKKEQIQKKIGSTYKHLKITYVENSNWARTNNIYSLWLAGKHLKHDFILFEGDIFFDHGVLRFIFKNRLRNVAYLSRYHPTMSGTVVEIDKKRKSIKKMIPSSDQGIDFNYSNTYKTVNIYYFRFRFFKKFLEPNLNLHIQTQSAKSYWELILGVLIYLKTPNIYGHIINREMWYEVDTPNDLELASYAFANKEERLNKLENLYGGYWRYDFLDFCFLYNLYFPTPSVYSQLSYELPGLINNYPSSQYKIRNLLSQLYAEVPFHFQNLIVGNGASELIRILNRHFIKKITIPVPSFNEYEDLAKSKIHYFPLPESKGFHLEAESYIKSVLDSQSNFALIINPNNPTGTVTSRKSLITILSKLPHLDGLIVDESFIDFTGDRKNYSVQDLIEDYPHLIVLRSLSKEFGIPGLRLGYIASANQTLLQKMQHYLPIWNINSLAERFIELLPQYLNAYQNSLKKIQQDRDKLSLSLKKFRLFQVFDGKANFVFCKILDKNINSRELQRKIFTNHKILIKDCSNKSNLNDRYIRISVRKSSENSRLIHALRQIEKELGGTGR